VKMLHHAGEIALSVGEHAEAERFLQDAASLSAHRPEQARTSLMGLTGNTENR